MVFKKKKKEEEVKAVETAEKAPKIEEAPTEVVAEAPKEKECPLKKECKDKIAKRVAKDASDKEAALKDLKKGMKERADKLKKKLEDKE